MYRLAIVVCVCFLVGCGASGFNRTGLREQMAAIAADGNANEYQVTTRSRKGAVTAEDIKEARSLAPQVKLPMKLAVRLIPPVGKAEWRWTVKDKKRVMKWGQKLKDRGLISDIFVMGELIRPGTTLPEIRYAAAKYGADAVMVVKAASELDQYSNISALLYLSIVGTYFIPGSHADALVMLEAAVWDVGNEYLYVTAEAEGEADKLSPVAFLDSEDVIEEAKKKALNELGKDFVERMSRL